jgi:hypothetical protein
VYEQKEQRDLPHGGSMYKKCALALMVLTVLAAPTLGSIRGNLTSTLEPDIIGKINQTDMIITPAEANLWLQERTLWQEHVFWTRMAIISILQNSEDKNPVINRLLKNYGDMSETIVPYYGNETAKRYGDLIKDHLLIAAALVSAVRDGNKTAIASANDMWYKNADEIAEFESNLSISLLPQDRKAMWREHLNLTKNETVQLANGDYNASIDTFDRIVEQGNMMADSLAQGIIIQFPERFH